MNEEIKEELEYIRDIFEERKEKFYDFYLSDYKLPCPEGTASFGDNFSDDEAHVYFYLSGPDDFMDLFDLLEEKFRRFEIENLYDEVAKQGLIPENLEMCDEYGDYYFDVKYTIAYWYCVKNDIIPRCDEVIEHNFCYDIKDIEIKIKKELKHIRALYEERKTDFDTYIDKRDELEDKLEDDELTEEEREKIEDELYLLKEPDCYNEDEGIEYFDIAGYEFSKLSDLLEKALYIDDLDILFNEAKENGYIQHGGEEYFLDICEGNVYLRMKWQEITKRMVAYWYCVKNNILPTCDYWESGDSIQYKY